MRECIIIYALIANQAKAMTQKTIQQKLQELLDGGASPKSLADKIGCHISTVYRIRDGFITDPSYSVGQAIDNLLAEIHTNAA